MAALAMSRNWGTVTTLLTRALRETSSLCNYGAAAAVEQQLESLSEAPVEVKLTKLLIDGEFVDAASRKTFPTVNSRSEQVIAQVAEGDAEDINCAMPAARKAFDTGLWPKLPAHKRSEILYNVGHKGNSLGVASLSGTQCA